jgi:hypothetical protein
MNDSYENADYPIAGYNFIKLLNTNDPSNFTFEIRFFYDKR